MDDSGADRDQHGRFAAGHPKLGGRRKGTTISRELMRQMDPEAIAARALAAIEDPKTPLRELVVLLAWVANRTEGTPVSRSVHLTATADALLPLGFDALPPGDRARVLAELRERAVRNALPEPQEITDAELVE